MRNPQDKGVTGGGGLTPIAIKSCVNWAPEGKEAL